MSTFSTGKAAEYLGVGVKTLQRWDREGTLKAERTSTGRRRYTQAALDAFMKRSPTTNKPRKPVAYCRVSSAAQKPDLKNQRKILEEFCAARGMLMDRIEARELSHLLIAHKDRLVRFGYNWFERFCAEPALNCWSLTTSN